MKNIIRFVLFIVFVTIGMSLSAQEIKVKDDVYEIKKGLIFKDGVDVTNTLSDAQKAEIFAAFEKEKQKLNEEEAAQKNLEKAEKERKKSEKEQKRAEKEQKQAEKKQKSAEKELKQKENAQSNYNKAIKKHKEAQKKYEKLKGKGKLSPIDEQKWLEKIEKLNEKVSKTKRRLK